MAKLSPIDKNYRRLQSQKGKRKIFSVNGIDEWFNRVDYDYKTKQSAEKEAKILRANGFYARILKIGNIYKIYIKTK